MVLKAQILAGGRGKGVFSSGLTGGVRVTKEYVHTYRSSVKNGRVHICSFHPPFSLYLLVLAVIHSAVSFREDREQF